MKLTNFLYSSPRTLGRGLAALVVSSSTIFGGSVFAEVPQAANDATIKPMEDWTFTPSPTCNFMGGFAFDETTQSANILAIGPDDDVSFTPLRSCNFLGNPYISETLNFHDKPAPDDKPVEGWVFTPSPICNPNVLLNYTIRTSLEFTKRGITREAQHIVTCDIEPHSKVALQAALSDMYPDAGLALNPPLLEIQLYYLAGSYSSLRQTSLEEGDAIKVLEETPGVPKGLYVSKDGTLTPIGVRAPSPSVENAEKVVQILTEAGTQPKATPTPIATSAPIKVEIPQETASTVEIPPPPQFEKYEDSFSKNGETKSVYVFKEKGDVYLERLAVLPGNRPGAASFIFRSGVKVIVVPEIMGEHGEVSFLLAFQKGDMTADDESLWHNKAEELYLKAAKAAGLKLPDYVVLSRDNVLDFNRSYEKATELISRTTDNLKTLHKKVVHHHSYVQQAKATPAPKAPAIVAPSDHASASVLPSAKQAASAASAPDRKASQAVTQKSNESSSWRDRLREDHIKFKAFVDDKIAKLKEIWNKKPTSQSPQSFANPSSPALKKTVLLASTALSSAFALPLLAFGLGSSGLARHRNPFVHQNLGYNTLGNGENRPSIIRAASLDPHPSAFSSSSHSETYATKKVLAWAKKNAPEMLSSMAVGGTVRIALAHFGATAAIKTSAAALFSLAATATTTAGFAAALAPFAASIVAAVAIGSVVGATTSYLKAAWSGRHSERAVGWQRKALWQGAKWGALGGALGAGIADSLSSDGFLHNLFHHQTPTPDIGSATTSQVNPTFHVHAEATAAPHPQPEIPAQHPSLDIPPTPESLRDMLSQEQFQHLSPEIQKLASSGNAYDLVRFCKEASFQLINHSNHSPDALKAGANLIKQGMELAREAGLDHSNWGKMLNSDWAYLAKLAPSDSHMSEAVRYAQQTGFFRNTFAQAASPT